MGGKRFRNLPQGLSERRSPTGTAFAGLVWGEEGSAASVCGHLEGIRLGLELGQPFSGL